MSEPTSESLSENDIVFYFDAAELPMQDGEPVAFLPAPDRLTVDEIKERIAHAPTYQAGARPCLRFNGNQHLILD